MIARAARQQIGFPLKVPLKRAQSPVNMRMGDAIDMISLLPHKTPKG